LGDVRRPGHSFPEILGKIGKASVTGGGTRSASQVQRTFTTSVECRRERATKKKCSPSDTLERKKGGIVLGLAKLTQKVRAPRRGALEVVRFMGKNYALQEREKEWRKGMRVREKRLRRCKTKGTQTRGSKKRKSKVQSSDTFTIRQLRYKKKVRGDEGTARKEIRRHSRLRPVFLKGRGATKERIASRKNFLKRGKSNLRGRYPLGEPLFYIVVNAPGLRKKDQERKSW